MQDIFKEIRSERADFLNNQIEVVPNYNFSQYQTVKKIHLYFNSHYEKGDYENVNGVLVKKVFHNLSRWRCEVATKMIDMDIKDFILVSNDPETDWNVYLLEKELKVWLKKNKMGQLLNEISRLLPIYGSVVIQKTKDGAQLIDLRHFYIDQSASSLEDARYILKRLLLSHQDMRKMGKAGWEHVQEAIDKFSGKYSQGYDLQGVSTTSNGSNLYYEGAGTQVARPQGAPLVEVFERYGEVPLSWFTNNSTDDDEYVMAKYCVAGVDSTVRNEAGNVVVQEDGIILYKEQIDELPFKEVHYTKTEGRWMGQGIVEILFENQRRINDAKNQEARGNEVGSLQIFQSEDDTIAQNVTTDLQNGEILRVKSLIQPIATEARNANSLQETIAKIEEHSDNLTFSRDVVSGDNPPSSATLGAVQIQTQQTTAVFDYKKENIGLFLGEFIQDLVFPQIEREINRTHIFRLAGSLQELQKLRKNYATNWANQKVIEHAIHGDPTSPDMPDLDQTLFDTYYKQGLDAISLMGDKIWTEVEDKFFKNLDYEVDIVTTGENKNIYSQINNGNALLMALAKDPTMATDPFKKKILFKVMSAMGWHMSELEDMDNEQLQTNQQLNEQNQQGPTVSADNGGGASNPNQPASNIPVGQGATSVA
jgi:hypothetical protein